MPSLFTFVARFLVVCACYILIASCAYISIGCVKDQYGNCTPGVIFEGVICPDDTPAPSKEDCPKRPPPPRDRKDNSITSSSSSLHSLDVIYFADGYEAAISQESPIGMLELFDDNQLVVDRLYTLWQVSRNVQSLNNSQDVYAWAIARASKFATPLSFELTLPNITVNTKHAQNGDMVNLLALQTFNGLPLGSVSLDYNNGS